jgi:hypothetical protein
MTRLASEFSLTGAAQSNLGGTTIALGSGTQSTVQAGAPLPLLPGDGPRKTPIAAALAAVDSRTREREAARANPVSLRIGRFLVLEAAWPPMRGNLRFII